MRFYQNKQLLLIFLFCSMMVSIVVSAQKNTSMVVRIDIETFREEVIGKGVQLIDVRTKEEYQKGYIDDAVNIEIRNLNAFLQKISVFDRERPIFIYCHSGVRSANAGKHLIQLGFKKVFDFPGGYKAWSKRKKMSE